MICDEGFVADSLRDFATAYEDNFGDEHEFEHGNGRLEFVEVSEPEEKQEDVVAGIAAKRKSLDDAALEAEYRQLEHMRDLEKRVKALAPRLRKMFDVAEALTKSRFYLGPAARESPLFCTEHITHRVGFFCDHPYFDSPSRNFSMTGYFGIANGGACGSQDLMIDRNGNVKRYDFTIASRTVDYKRIYIEDLECVLKKFDEVEKGLFEYAKNPISR